MSMRACKPMRNTKISEKFGERSKLTTSITLHNLNFTVKLKLNHGFKLNKLSKGIRLESQGKNPNKPRKGIYTCQKIGVTP
jgi:hypothetical protein